MLSHQLHKIGVSKIVQKADGRSGLAFLNNYLQNQQQYGESPPPHTIIILDVNMPIMDGFEFLQRFAELKTQVT
jgi:CheY-like chemotaxis protein